MKLLTPFAIGNMRLKNRMVMAPMTTNYANEDQTPSRRLQDFLVERARGGVGLITVEVCTVDPKQKYQPQSMTLGDDRFIDAHRRLTDALHAHGARVQPQITHPGPESMVSIYHGEAALGPSHGTGACHGLPSRELQLAELESIVDDYAKAAVRARDAGYDGIELHAAHAYMLLGAFLSPLKNHRQDEYGADTLENRARLLLQVIAKIKSEAGQDFPLTLRISGFERVPGGRDSYDTAALACLLEAAGVDAFHVSGGVSDPMVSQMICGPEYTNGYNLPGAEAIKRVVNVPVMAVGRFLDPEVAEKALQEDRTDLIVMGRAILADPQLPNKLLAGKARTIRRCISCQNCIDSMFLWPMDARMNCAVNAATGRESTLNYRPAAQAKKVVVIGGGPGGMEAARVAALRGHRVTLVEKQKRLGGSLVAASVVHGENQRLLDFLISQVDDLPIDIALDTQATTAMIQSLEPDEVVVATGARLNYDAIAGLDNPGVITGSLLRELASGRPGPAVAVQNGLLRFAASTLGPAADRYASPQAIRSLARAWLPLGKRVVIVGGDLPAIELAEFLARRGRRVSLLEKSAIIAGEIGPKRRFEHEMRLDRLGVTINTGVEVTALGPRKVSFITPGGRPTSLEADSVIVTGEPVADTGLHDELLEANIRSHCIGDASGPGLIVKAVYEGNAIAHSF